MRIKSLICIALSMILGIQTGVVSCSSAETSKKTKYQIQEGIYKEVESDSKGNFINTVISGSGALTERCISTFGDATVQEGITELGAFSLAEGACYTLKLPSTLTTIGDSAFESLTNLKEITIPENVSKIGNNAFLKCVNLQKIVNNSSIAVEVPKSGTTLLVGYEYYVDGKKVSEVQPGKTAIGTPRKFKLNLVLNKGKIVGKTPTTYTYGENMTLPKAKRKGYQFMGWSFKDKWTNGIRKLNPQGVYMAGEETRYAQFAKVKYKAKKKSFEVKCTNYNSAWLIIAYSTQKNRSDEKRVEVYNPTKKGVAYMVVGNKEKKIKITGSYKKYKVTFKQKQRYKKNWIKVTIPKLKSGKKYYVRLKQRTSSVGDDEVTKEDLESIWFGHKTIKTR